MSELTDTPGVLQSRVERVRAALAANARCEIDQVELRVAVSVMQLGLVARLIAPAIGAVALGFEPLSVAPADVWWQDMLGGPFPVAMTSRRESEDALHGSIVETITVDIQRRYRISGRVAWGNVASAANGAAKLVGVARPELAGAARAAADEILADPRVEDGRLRSGPTFRRSSCCLLYRLAGRSAVCGDCVLPDLR
jgi:hypothetical protein